MGQQTFEFLLLAMSALAVIVFVALYYVRAGYGMFHTPKWGLSVTGRTDEAFAFPCNVCLGVWNSSVRFDAALLFFFRIAFISMPLSPFLTLREKEPMPCHCG